jgi:hypothetical protein
MRKQTIRSLSLAALLLLGTSSAFAQLPGASARDLSLGVGAFPVRTMDFDLWCQQTQRYSPERCAARRPEDVRAFEDYRNSIERYEIEHLKQVQKDEGFRARANRDPMQTVTGKQDGLP